MWGVIQLGSLAIGGSLWYRENPYRRPGRAAIRHALKPVMTSGFGRNSLDWGALGDRFRRGQFSVAESGGIAATHDR